MKNYSGILLVLTVALLLISCRQQAPNLLLIITDDQGYGDLSLHGNSILKTPNLDLIGLNGTRLDNFHVSPVCAPTRAAVLTGRWPMSTGTYWVTRGGEVMDADEYTIAEVLKDNAYSTGYFGKWHNGAHHPHHPLSQGFDVFLGFTAGHLNRYFNPDLEHNGKMIRKEGYVADIFTNAAIEYIREHRDDPFFCYLAYNTPHSPFQVPDEYFNSYKDKVEELDSSLRTMNASVYGMLANIDDNVGRIMETLKELDLEENTIVVFMSDNGPNTIRFNGEMKGRKAWVNDGGVRVPCFIQWKGHIPDHKVLRSTTAHVDILPTLVSLMGVDFKPRKEIHGIDLSKRIMGEDSEEERLLYTHVNHGEKLRPFPGAIRSREWRLTFTDPEQPELTRRSDVREVYNLADSFPGITESLMSQYHQWFEPFESHLIPPIAVGVIDSVILPAHEGFLKGSAHFRWSEMGWSNDWVRSLDGEDAYIFWSVEVLEKGPYECRILYTSASDSAILWAEVAGESFEKELPRFITEQDSFYSRIDRPAEAIGQSWGRVNLGQLILKEGRGEISLHASSPDVEILELVLKKVLPLD